MNTASDRLKEACGTKIDCECCICANQFRFAALAHEARKVADWCGLVICRDCERTHGNGVDLWKYPRLRRNLRTLRIPLAPNKAGLLPLPNIGGRKQAAAATTASPSPPDRQVVIPMRRRAA